MEKPIFTVMLLISLFVATGPIHTVHAQSGTGFAQYTVLDSSNSTNAWYNADYTEFFNYHIEQGSTIEVNFTQITPSDEIVDIKVGNLTRLGISDDEVGENLVLSYWEMKGELGILANSSWDKIKTDLESISFDYLNIKEEPMTYLGRTLETIRITMVSGGQNSTLIYEKRSGVLLEALTGFTQYKISIILDSTDLIPSYTLATTVEALADAIFMMMAFAIITIIRVVYKRKN